VLIRPVMRMSFMLAHANRRVELAILGLMSPSTRKVMEPIFLEIAPENAETLTPAEARARYGYDKPSEAHMQWRARQQERIMGGQAPSDAGLVESQGLLGAMA
jgi:hypothetical protein